MCMRYMGVDYGTKKIGVAVSDERGVMAFPLCVVPNDGNKALFGIIRKEGPSALVIGESKNLSGADNVLAQSVRELVTDITLEFGVPVHLVPEHFTSIEARRNTKTALADASAAALLLQGFLDTQEQTS